MYQIPKVKKKPYLNNPKVTIGGLNNRFIENMCEYTLVR